MQRFLRSRPSPRTTGTRNESSHARSLTCRDIESAPFQKRGYGIEWDSSGLGRQVSITLAAVFWAIGLPVWHARVSPIRAPIFGNRAQMQPPAPNADSLGIAEPRVVKVDHKLVVNVGRERDASGFEV